VFMSADYLTGEPYDRTLRDYSQAILAGLNPSDKLKVRSISLCGRRVIAPQYGEGGVFLLSNGSRAKFFGSTHCGNMFACPTCTAKAMQKLAAQIDAGIDKLRNEYFGIMVTLTIPHLYYMKNRETTDILYQTFQRFRLAAKSSRPNPVRTMFRELGIIHWIAVCEYTFGKNGWHPHFHCIFWCKRDKAKDVLKYEKFLNDWWLKRAKKYTLEYWIKNKLHFKTEEKMVSTVNNLYDKAEKSAGVLIGKTKTGKVREALSGSYISGWGANHELTGLKLKTAKLDHYTPYQILELAAMGDKFFEKLWVHFVLAVRQQPIHRRVIWSHTGISKMCKQASQVKLCKDLIKKNTGEIWKVLLWFNREQWFCIKQIPYMEGNILFIARHCKEILLEFLDDLHIEYNLPESNYFSEHIENIFNSVA